MHRFALALLVTSALVLSAAPAVQAGGFATFLVPTVTFPDSNAPTGQPAAPKASPRPHSAPAKH